MLADRVDVNHPAPVCSGLLSLAGFCGAGSVFKKRNRGDPWLMATSSLMTTWMTPADRLCQLWSAAVGFHGSI